MGRGPTKGSKRYTCRNEACERFGRPQYISPWVVEKRCKYCGSENIEEVAERVDEKRDVAEAAPGLPAEPVVEPQEAPAEPPLEETPAEPSPEEVEEGAEPEGEEAKAPEITEPAATDAPPPVATIKPKKYDLVRCKKCGWAVHWDPQHHTKSACHAAGCGSSDIEIAMPAEGK